MKEILKLHTCPCEILYVLYTSQDVTWYPEYMCGTLTIQRIFCFVQIHLHELLLKMTISSHNEFLKSVSYVPNSNHLHTKPNDNIKKTLLTILTLQTCYIMSILCSIFNICNILGIVTTPKCCTLNMIRWWMCST